MQIDEESLIKKAKFVHPDTLWKELALAEAKKRKEMKVKRKEFLAKFHKDKKDKKKDD